MFSQNRRRDTFFVKAIECLDQDPARIRDGERAQGNQSGEDAALSHISPRFIQQNLQESLQILCNYGVTDYLSSFGMYFTLSRTTGNYRAT